MRIFTHLLRSELRLFLREPQQVFFAVAFPTLLVVILGSIPAFREPKPELGGLRYVDVYVPIAIALALGMLALQVSPFVLAGYRERGVLRRLATTPARPIVLLGAQLAIGLLTAVTSTALVLLVGRLAFGVRRPGSSGSFVLSFALTAMAIFALGLVIAALAPSGKTANTIGTFLFFPSMFFAGLWFPREAMPRLIQRIGDFTPLGAGERALHEAATGHWPSPIAATVLLGYFLVFGAAAVRFFRWR
jgi:ABC-2 type transport system permease protein